MIVYRKYCILSKKKLKNFIKIKNFPIFSGSTSQDFKKDLFCDLNYGISNSSGILQLQKLVKPKILYSKYHSEALGDLWRQHNQAFSKFLIKYCDERIIEMGGGNNQIARICSINRKIKKWFNFEIIKTTSKSYKLNKKITFINKPIESNIVKKYVKKKTTFVHSHVLEHLHSPIGSLKNLLKHKEINKMIFSIPNMEFYLKAKQSNILNFEHTYLLTMEILKGILAELNFSVKKKVYFKNHSIFIYAQKKCINNVYKLPSLKKYNTAMKNLINFYIKKNHKLNKIFLNKNKRVNFIFGGHVFSQFLFATGLKEKKFNCILDNSNLKNNQRLYGSKIQIQKPEIIKKIDEPLVLINVGQYKNEIISQLKKINKNVKLIFI